jgi:hypothetical protein
MRQNRGRVIAYILTFVVLIGFLVFALIDSKRSVKTTKSQDTTEVQTDRPLELSGGTGAEAPTSPTKKPDRQSDAAATPQKPTTTQLPNSGPGDTLGIFLVTSVLATGVGYVYSLRTARLEPNKL